MSPAKPLADDFWTSPQIDLAQLAAFKDAGVTAVVNNRVEGEEPGQPTSDAVAAACAALDLAYLHVPVAGGAVTGADLDAFDAFCAEAPGRVLGFCKSGTRSALVWAGAQARQGVPVADLTQALANAGYAPPGVADWISQFARA